MNFPKKQLIIAVFLFVVLGLTSIYVLIGKPPKDLTGHVTQPTEEVPEIKPPITPEEIKPAEALTCEEDRSCCQNIGLNYICFHTAEYIKGNLKLPINQDYLILNYSQSDSSNIQGKGENKISYYGSMFYLRSDGSVDGGITRVFIKETIGYVISPLKFSNSDTYHWTPASRKEYKKDWGLGFEHEGEVAFINEDTIIWNVKFKSIENKNRTLILPGEINPSMDQYTIKYRNDIDGKYPGFEINVKESCTAWCSSTFDMTFLVVINDTPTSYTKQDNNYQVQYDLSNTNPEIPLTVIFTLKQYESSVSDWIENPNLHISNTKTTVTNWLRKFKEPTYISNNNDLLRAYYRNLAGFWMSVIKKPVWRSSSNYGNLHVIPPSMSRYQGAWMSDTARICIGLIEASDDDEVIDLCKEQVDLFVNNMQDGHFRSDIRDSYFGTGLQSPLLQIAAWKIFEKNKDTTWLSSIYDEMVSDLNYRDGARKDSNGLYYCLGLECGDGRVNSVAIDVNSEMYLGWKSLAYMAQVLGKNGDYTKYFAKSEFITNKIGYFWDSTDKYFFDLQKDSYNKLKSPYEHGTAFAWGFMWANIPEAINNPIYANGMALAITDANRYKTQILIPDVPKNDDDYDPGRCTLWWCGNSWSNLAWRAVIGLKNAGKLTESENLRQKTLRDIAYYSFGLENYYSDEQKIPPSAGQMYGWTMAHFIHLANTDEFKVNPPTGTETLTIPQILSPKADATLYSDYITTSYSSIGATSYTVKADGITKYSGPLTTYTWQNVPVGEHTIQVTATDGSSQKSSYVTFTRQENNFQIKHPRLLLTKEEIPAILSNVQTGQYQFRYNQLISYANSASDWNPSWTLGSIIWSKAFIPMNLGLAYQLTGNQAYLNKAKSYLLGFASFTPEQYANENIHGVLDTFWQLSIAYDLIYEGLTPDERRTIVNFLYDGCLTNTGIEDGIGYYTYYEHGNGHGLRQTFGMCSLAIYGEHETDPFQNLGTDWFDLYRQSADNYLASYFNGSYTNDGISYQDYGLVHTLSYVHAYDRMFPDESLFEKYQDTLCGIADYYTFAIWDTDRQVGGESIKRIDHSDMEYVYWTTPPQVFAFLASKCRSEVAQWYLLEQFKKTDNYQGYNNLQSSEDLVWFDKTVQATHPKDILPLSWKDSHDGLVIWRDGWTLADDFHLTFKSDDEVGGHPHADDNSILIHYGDELLTDTSYKNGTNEIAGGECYHNTLVVDQTCDMRWQDRGRTNPTYSRQLFGKTQGMTFEPGSCDWPDGCYFMPIDFRGHIRNYEVNSVYRAVQGVKPYSTLDQYTRYVVLLNTTIPLVIMKDQITSTLLHMYDINFVYPYDKIKSIDGGLLIENFNSNLFIKTIYNSSPMSPVLNYKKYTKTYKGNYEYEWISSSALRTTNVRNLTVVNALVATIDPDTNPYTFAVEEEENYIIVYIYGPEEFTVIFDKADAMEVRVESGTARPEGLPDPRFPRMATFDGSTTNITGIDDLSSVPDFILEKSQVGKISFRQPVDLRNHNLDSYVRFGRKSIYVDTPKLPGLNRSADLEFYQIDYKSPIMLRDGEVCRDCLVLGYENSRLRVRVDHFTNYSVSSAAGLYIYDTTDEELVYEDETVSFKAEYYNQSDMDMITDGSCILTISGSDHEMQYINGSYVYSLPLASSTDWQVLCSHNEFDSMAAVDHALVSQDSCGNSVCEETDRECAADCDTETNCGYYGNICQTRQICIEGTCIARESYSTASASSSSSTVKKGSGGTATSGPVLKPQVKPTGQPLEENKTVTSLEELAETKVGELKLLAATDEPIPEKPSAAERFEISDLGNHWMLMIFTLVVTAAVLAVYEYRRRDKEEL